MIPRTVCGPSAGFKHRFNDGRDLCALLWGMRQMVKQAGSIQSFFLRGHHAADEDVSGSLNRYSAAVLALDYTDGLRDRQHPARLLFSVPVSRPGLRQRLQTTLHVSALDGSPGGRHRSWVLGRGISGTADYSGRYPYQPHQPLSRLHRTERLPTGAWHRKLRPPCASLILPIRLNMIFLWLISVSATAVTARIQAVASHVRLSESVRKT